MWVSCAALSPPAPFLSGKKTTTNVLSPPIMRNVCRRGGKITQPSLDFEHSEGGESKSGEKGPLAFRGLKNS